MKYIKKYKIFESQSYQKITDIYETLKDICLELSDRNIKYGITPSDDINRKILGLQLFTNTLDENRHKVPFFIMINSRSIFSTNLTDWTDENTKWFIDFLYQIESYMSSMGFETNINSHNVKSIADMTGWKKHRSPKEFGQIMDMTIRDIKIEFTKK